MLRGLKKYVRSHHGGCASRVDSLPCDCGFEVALKELDNFEKFVRLVADMRTAQKNYFKLRLQGDLKSSKQYEADVDKLVARVLAGEGKPADGVQKALL